MEYMESIKSKRGRPATGRRNDGTLYLRIPKEKKEGVKKIVREFLGMREPEKKVVIAPVVVSDGEVEELKRKLMAAVDEAAGLRDEVAALELSLEEEKNKTYDEKMVGLLFRCRQAEEAGKAKEGPNWGA